MSLITDQIFYMALMADVDIVTETEGRIYSTAVPCPDDQLDNTKAPYVIVTFDGLTNEGLSKDNSYEGMTDRVTVGITAVAEDRRSLGELMTEIRQQVERYFLEIIETEESDLVPYAYQLSANEVAYDSMKPCYYQTLQYVCETNP